MCFNKCRYARNARVESILNRRGKVVESPSPCVVFLKALVEVIIGEVFLVVILHGHDRHRLRLLFEILDVVRCVPSLHGSQVVGALVLSLPEKVLAQ